MIGNDIVTGIIGITAAYLIGSFPSAYIIARLITGKDIRQLGSGNVGAHNIFREVGLAASVFVGIFDVGKGALAVWLTHWLMDVPLYEVNIVVLLAGIAVVAGHIWSIYLRLAGGNGLGATVGVLIIVLPREFLIFIPVLFVLYVITHNIVLSTNIGLFSVPVSAWFLEKEGLYVLFCLILIVMLALNFIPTARAALVKAGSRQKIIDGLLRREKTRPDKQ